MYILDDCIISDIFAVIGREVYSSASEKYFGNILITLLTLFQLLTLDDWFDIYIDATKNDPGEFDFTYCDHKYN